MYRIKPFLLSAFGVGLLSLPVMAQQFVIAPMVTIDNLRSGQSKGSINITNNAREPLRMRVYAEDFTYDRVKGFTLIRSHDRSIVPYIQFSPRELVIPPGITRNVRVASTIPSSLPDGEYRAAIFVEDLKPRDIQANNGNRLVITARVASVFFISKGNTNADLQINTVVWDNTQKKLKLLVTNKGSRTAYPEIDWRITQNNQEIAKGSYGGVLLQAGQERELSLKKGPQDLSLASGNYDLSGTITTVDKKVTPFTVKITIP